MPYVSKKDIAAAREIGILDYLYKFEPEEVVRTGRNSYSLKSHDSLKISNGKWFWFSRGIGGKTALDYLIYVKDMRLVEAVLLLLGNTASKQTTILDLPKQADIERGFVVPEFLVPPKYMHKYLYKRGISQEIIKECYKRKLIAETARYHNAAFLGYDEEGECKYLFLRGTINFYRGEAACSDKRYAFQITDAPDVKEVHVFEAAIDLLSYATLLSMKRKDWTQYHLLSLGGVTRGQNKLPIALDYYLEHHPETETVYLHLDNDEPGQVATQDITALLQDRFKVVDEPPPEGKDYNDYIQIIQAV